MTAHEPALVFGRGKAAFKGQDVGVVDDAVVVMKRTPNLPVRSRTA